MPLGEKPFFFRFLLLVSHFYFLLVLIDAVMRMKLEDLWPRLHYVQTKFLCLKKERVEHQGTVCLKTIVHQ